jgi:flagellar hook-associated protein 2
VVTQQQTAWQGINSAVLALGNAATTLSDPSLATDITATSSNTSILTATGTSSQSQGDYTVTVDQLAQNQQMISSGYDAADASVGTGTVSLQVGSAAYPPITIDSSNDTLSGVATAINKANLGVTASVVDTGTEQGATEFKLMLISNVSGTAGALTVSMNLGSNPPTFTTTQPAQDAEIQLGTGSNALPIYSSSNTITGAIPGVTLQLNSASPGTTVNVSLSQNTDNLQSAVQGLLTQYNSLNSAIGAQTSYNSTTNTPGGPLFGSPTLLGLQQQVSNLVTGTQAVSGAYTSLAQIGITADSSGNLSISDQSAFNKAIGTDPQDVVNLFQDPKQGIATQLNSMVTEYTDPTKGVLTAQNTSLTTEYNSMQSQITMDTQMASQEQTRLTDMFSELQADLSSINTQSQLVDAQIAAMENTGTSTSSTSTSSSASTQPTTVL